MVAPDLLIVNNLMGTILLPRGSQLTVLESPGKLVKKLQMFLDPFLEILIQLVEEISFVIFKE